MQSQDDFWGNYWAAGALTSMADGFESNYQGALKQTWIDFFASFASQSRLLDIGTGNGAILMIAAELSAEKDLRLDLHGADRATIDPRATIRNQQDLLSGVSFYSQTAAEKLPFADNEFDGVCGQYSFEYTEHARALDEVRRVLRAGGRAQFVMHDHDSEVLRRGREQLRQIELIEQTGFYDAVDALLPYMAMLTKPGGIPADVSADAERCRQQLNKIAATIGDSATKSFSPESLQYAMGFASRALDQVAPLGLEQALATARQGRSETHNAKARYLDLCRAAGPPGQSQTIAGLVSDKGFVDVRLTPVYHDREVLVGQLLTFAKENVQS